MITPGTRVGNLLIGALLGRGGMGEVYAAEQVSLKRPVAVKRIADHLASTPDAIRRFEREAQVVARIRSEHVVGIYELGTFSEANGNAHVLLIMELVDGGLSLKRLLDGPLPWAATACLMRQAAEGLAAGAEHQIVHRDIKPDNILLTRRGVAKITDFGLAKALDSTSMTLGGSIMGTPAYMAPEVCRGQVADVRSDLYSLGATWYHLLTGRTPYSSPTTLGMLRAHVEDPTPDLRAIAADVPAPIADLVARLLAKEPSQRPASAAELVQLIDALPFAVPRTVPELAARFVAPSDAPTLIPTPLTQRPTDAPTMPAGASAPTVVTPTAAPAAPIPTSPQRSSRLPLILAGVGVIAAAAGIGAWAAGSRTTATPPTHTSPPAAAPVPAPANAPVVTQTPPPAPAVQPTPPPPAAQTLSQPQPQPTPAAPPRTVVQAKPAHTSVVVDPAPELRAPTAPTPPVAAPAVAPAPAPAPAVATTAAPVTPPPPAAAVPPPTTKAPDEPKPTVWQRLVKSVERTPSEPPPVQAPADGPAPVVPADTPEGLVLQIEAAQRESRFGDLQLLADTLDARGVLPDQQEAAEKSWKTEEKRCWAEFDRIEELARIGRFLEAQLALGVLPSDPVHGTRKVVRRHADLRTSLHDDAVKRLATSLRRCDELLKKGNRGAAREELDWGKGAAEALGRMDEWNAADRRFTSP